MRIWKLQKYLSLHNELLLWAFTLKQHKCLNLRAFCFGPQPLPQERHMQLFSETPWRQDVLKTLTMTEVCQTDTYTGRGWRKHPLFPCGVSPSNPAPSETTQNRVLQHKHARFPMPVRSHECVCVSQQSRAKGAQRGTAGGKFSWSSGVWLVSIPQNHRKRTNTQRSENKHFLPKKRTKKKKKDRKKSKETKFLQ